MQEKNICFMWCNNQAPNSVYDIASKLELDPDYVRIIVDEDLNHDFSLDDLLTRVSEIHQKRIKEQQICENCKKKVLLGKDIAEEPKDTREHRKKEERIQELNQQRKRRGLRDIF